MPEARANAGLVANLRWKRGALDIAFDAALPARGITALFGPSGAGKSSCLRAIAGLDRDVEGTLRLDGATWQDSARRVFVPSHKRRIGYVFQDAGLFAHLSVQGNLDYGHRRAGRPPHLDRERLIDVFGLRHLLARRVDALSGGERQRVAIVRALLADPALLLFDEPLSALDAVARSGLLAALETLHSTLALPMIYVSHAVDEVARLADHLVLLDAGRVVAQGALQETLTRMDLPAALAEAAGTVIEGRIAGFDARDHLAEFVFDGGTLWLPRDAEARGKTLRCRIAARDVTLSLAPQAGSALNQLRCRVVAIGAAEHPAHCVVQLLAGSNRLLARITRRSRDALALQPGMEAWAQVKATALGG